MNEPQPSDGDHAALLITGQQVADLLQMSLRSVWRMRDAGSMPAPIRLGSAVRWQREQIEAWINAGCPPIAGGRSEANQKHSHKEANDG